MGDAAVRSDTGSVRKIVIPYLPRAAWLPFHLSSARWRVAVAHRRAGKTVAFVNEAIKGALTCTKPNPRFGYVAPLLGQAKTIAWDYVKQYTRDIPGRIFNEAELRCDLPNAGRFRLYGADNPDALRGQYFDGVILDEFGDMDPRAWTEVLRPTLSDRQGWAAFGGTPRGKNEFFRVHQRALGKEANWDGLVLKASETGILTPEELTDAKATMDEASYLREYECSFDAAILGAYYAKEMMDAEAQGRICRVPIDPIVPVNTSWDLGIHDPTAIWFFQDVGLERRFIDYVEFIDSGLPHIMKVLEEKGYRYGRMILPNDIQVREMGTGVSRLQTMKSLGLRNWELVQLLDIEDGINATRLMLPRCWFDSGRCAHGIEALKQYRREWDDKLKTWRQRELHDWASHAAAAMRYLAMSAPAKLPPEKREREYYQGSWAG